MAQLPWLARSHSASSPEVRLSEPETLDAAAEIRPVEILIVDDSDDDVLLLKEAFVDCPLVDFVEAAKRLSAICAGRSRIRIRGGLDWF